ncbi:MAG: DUF2971 domain-containing protein [Bacteroidales bacterium]|nr:DUF2971 domain-containing protein [Bacteroidales bacterium]
MVGTSIQLVGYKHIHMLNGYSLPKDKSTVFKYMPLDRFVNSVDNKELVFVSPETWYDPFEQLYYDINCSSRGYHTEDIVCMCVSEKSSTNEDACWRVYAGTNGKTVRLSIEKDILLQLLDEYSDREGFEVYIGKVNYMFEKKDIKGLHDTSSLHYCEFFPETMKVEHYLSLMLLKRSAFSYENEVRLFLVRDLISERLLKIPCDYKANKVVSNVMLSPYPPVRETGDLAFKVREKLNKEESDEIKTVLKDKVGCRIQQSLLYKVYPRVTEP